MWGESCKKRTWHAHQCRPNSFSLHSRSNQVLDIKRPNRFHTDHTFQNPPSCNQPPSCLLMGLLRFPLWNKSTMLCRRASCIRHVEPRAVSKTLQPSHYGPDNAGPWYHKESSDRGFFSLSMSLQRSSVMITSKSTTNRLMMAGEKDSYSTRPLRNRR